MGILPITAVCTEENELGDDRWEILPESLRLNEKLRAGRFGDLWKGECRQWILLPGGSAAEATRLTRISFFFSQVLPSVEIYSNILYRNMEQNCYGKSGC